MDKTFTLLILIVAVSLLLRLINLNFPQEFYFDENYTAFTGTVLAIRNDPEIWKPSATPINPPRGYEWAHPPLARLFIAGAVRLLGESPWVWRLPSLIAGIGSIILIYLIGTNLVSTTAGLLAALLLSLDGLSFAQSRIGTPDALLTSFILLTLFFLSQRKRGLAAISSGLALSTKWSAITLLPLLILFPAKNHIGEKERITPKLVRLIIPFLVYLGFYVPFFRSGLGAAEFFSLQKSMLIHGVAITQTHSFSSPWFAWPFGGKPILYYSNGIKQLWAAPNFLVFWGELLALGSLVVRKTGKTKAKPHQNRTVSLLGVYLLLLSPWVAIWILTGGTRSTFLHYYLPSLAILHLISAGWYAKLLANKNLPFRTGVRAFLVSAALLFLFIYPKLTGL